PERTDEMAPLIRVVRSATWERPSALGTGLVMTLLCCPGRAYATRRPSFHPSRRAPLRAGRFGPRWSTRPGGIHHEGDAADTDSLASPWGELARGVGHKNVPGGGNVVKSAAKWREVE